MQKTLFIRNTGTYALTFNFPIRGTDRKFTFDCLRIYTDTGNIATSGITEISEADYQELLTKCRVFKDHVDKGILVLTDNPKVTRETVQIDNLVKENTNLKTQLKAGKKESVKNNTEKATLKKENESLKAQLESLKKSVTAKKDKDVSKVF